MPDRVTLTNIASMAWEHPADRAALNALRAIPGFDEIVRKVAGFIGDRGVHHLFLADAVRVGPQQRPALWALWTEVCETLDWPEPPALYVTQTPLANAGAVGFDKPVVVINSGSLEILPPEQQRFLLAHELGHIMSGHVVYRTIATIILTVGVSALPFIATVALFPFQMALLEWYRKSELSCDRAALLAGQDRDAAMWTFLRMAGGPEYGDQLALEPFVQQAREYEVDGTTFDTVLKIMNTALRPHPFHTVRAGELQRWVDSGRYQAILDGDYLRRDDPAAKAPDVGADVREAAAHYGDAVKQAASQVADVANRARSAFSEAFKGARR